MDCVRGGSPIAVELDDLPRMLIDDRRAAESDMRDENGNDAMLDTRRLPIPGLDDWLVDARCRVFRRGEHRPVAAQWPYVTVEADGQTISFKVAEATALAFLGQDACEEIFRELFAANPVKGHPRTRRIALDRGLSEWAVLQASRCVPEQFDLVRAVRRIEAGRVDPTMCLHSLDGARVDRYDVYRAEAGDRGARSPAVFDHVLSVAGEPYRFRQSGMARLAQVGDIVSFRYRLKSDRRRYVVRSTLVRTPFRLTGTNSIGE